MSEGPIKREREAYKPPIVSTTNAARVCIRAMGTGRALCGRRSAPLTDEWAKTTCADCVAAARADEQTEEKDQG